MFYFVLAAVVFVALFLIFRDDHDRRYDQRSGSGRQYLAEKQAPASAPSGIIVPWWISGPSAERCGRSRTMRTIRGRRR